MSHEMSHYSGRSLSFKEAYASVLEGDKRVHHLYCGRPTMLQTVLRFQNQIKCLLDTLIQSFCLLNIIKKKFPDDLTHISAKKEALVANGKRTRTCLVAECLQGGTGAV